MWNWPFVLTVKGQSHQHLKVQNLATKSINFTAITTICGFSCRGEENNKNNLLHKGYQIISTVLRERRARNPVYTWFYDAFQWRKRKWTADHIAVHTCVYHASPRCTADHLCSDFVPAYVTSTKKVKGPRAQLLRQSVAKEVPDLFRTGYLRKQKCFKNLYTCTGYSTVETVRTKSFATCERAPDKTYWWCIFLLCPCRGRLRTQ